MTARPQVGLDRAFGKRHNAVMATTESVINKRRTSQVVKVTGMSEELLRLLDARVQQQQATGRAEYIRELIRRDALAASQEQKPRRHKARRRRVGAASEQSLLAEYHALVDAELEQTLSPAQRLRLSEVENALDRAEAQTPEAQSMTMRLEETAAKLDALLAAVQSLPQAGA